MKAIFMVLLVFYAGLTGVAQQQLVTGIIQNQATKEPLADCSIYVLHTQTGTRSDIKGKFAISMPLQPGARLLVSCTGYATDTVQLADGSLSLIVLLKAVPANLNEVVVTGVSRATLIRENPVAVSVVSAKNIDIAVEANIVDALVKHTPGLNAVKTGPNISKPFIRGLGYNRVLTLYDGIRQEGQQWGDEHGLEVDAYNIEKAEIIKGPASLMFGSDALAGVVSMFPSLPKEKDGIVHGRVLSEYQSNNGLIGNGARIGSGNGYWQWMVNGSLRQAKNYTNPVDGRVYNSGFNEHNIAATVGHTFATGYTQLTATLYDNLQGIPDGSRDAISRKFTKQQYEGILDDITNRPLVSEQELNSYALGPLHQHIQHYRLYSNNHYRLGNGEADASIGFQQNIRREYNHPTAAEQAGLFVQLNTINYGFKYALPVFSNIEMILGVNGMYQHNKSKQATDFPVPDYRLLDIGSWLYGKWKYKELTVSGGIRYDTRQLSGDDFYVQKNNGSRFDRQAHLPDTAGAVLQFSRFHKQFHGISMSLGAAYQLSNTISLKANIARGYRSPNITEFAANGLDPGAHIIYLGNRNFVPEFSFQQDLGLFFTNKNLQASCSLFNNNIENYIYLAQLADAGGTPVTDAQGNKTFQYQQAAAHLYGAESSLDIHPQIVKGFSFNNSVAITYGINKKKDYAEKGNNGEYLPLIPPLKWLSSVSQEIKIGSKIVTSVNTSLAMEYNAAQNRYLALFNTETATPQYTLMAVSAGTRMKCGKFNLQCQLQVNNLFDVAYQSHLSRLKYFEYYAISPNGHLGMYNPGRSFCLKLIADF